MPKPKVLFFVEGFTDIRFAVMTPEMAAAMQGEIVQMQAAMQQALMKAWRLPELLVKISDDHASNHPQVQAMGIMQPVDYPGIARPAPVADVPIWMSETRRVPRQRAPTIGEHTEQQGTDRDRRAGGERGDGTEGHRVGGAALVGREGHELLDVVEGGAVGLQRVPHRREVVVLGLPRRDLGGVPRGAPVVEARDEVVDPAVKQSVEAFQTRRRVGARRDDVVEEPIERGLQGGCLQVRP